MCLAYATDALLDPLVDYTVFEGFNKVDTVMRYRTKVSVEADERPYLQRYAGASEVAELCIDVLRLVRWKMDIDVLCFGDRRAGSLTPKIRKTWANRYQPDWARYQPHRFDFGHRQRLALTDAELERLRGTISLLLGVRGVTSKV